MDKLSNSPSKAGTLLTFSKEGDAETYGKRSPEFDGLPGGERRELAPHGSFCACVFLLIVRPLPGLQLRAADNSGAFGSTRCSVRGPARRMCATGENLVWRGFFAELGVGFVPTPGGSKNLRESHAG